MDGELGTFRGNRYTIIVLLFVRARRRLFDSLS